MYVAKLCEKNSLVYLFNRNVESALQACTQLKKNFMVSDFILNLTIFLPLISHRLPEKPWKVPPGADVSDFFNYGMNEDARKVAAWIIGLHT